MKSRPLDFLETRGRKKLNPLLFHFSAQDPSEATGIFLVAARDVSSSHLSAAKNNMALLNRGPLTRVVARLLF